MAPRIPKIVIILLFALILRLIFSTGFSSSDDFILIEAANQLNHNVLDFTQLDNHIPFRLALLLPTSFLIQVFGINDFILTLFPFLCSLGIVFLTYLITKKLFNTKIALLAAFLISLFPLEVLHASILVAEPIGEFFMLLAIYLFLLDKPWGFLFSGISIGLSYLAKETFALALPILLLYLLIKKRKIIKEHFILALGFLLPFAFELIYFYLKTGDSLSRFTVLKSSAVLIAPESSSLLSHVLLKYLTITLTPFNFQAGFFFYLFYAAIILVLIKKIKSLYPLAIFSLLFLLYFNFGSTSFSNYTPLPRSIRYLMVISSPLCIISSVVLWNFKEKIRKYLIPILLIFLTVTSLIYLSFASNTMYESESVNSLSSILPSLNLSKSIYIDNRNEIALKYLTKFNASLIPFKKLPKGLTSIKDSYIILDYETINNRDISFGNSTKSDLLSYAKSRGELIANYESYQKPICKGLISSAPSFLKQKLRIGCKYTNISVYKV